MIRVERVSDGHARSGYGHGGQARRCYTQDGGYVDNRDPRYGNGDYRNDGYYDGREGVYGDGYRRNGGGETGRRVATVIGGVVGAVLGSQVGGGSARYATSAIGSMVGGMAGRGIYDQHARPPRRGQVTVCDPVGGDGRYRPMSEGDAYDVTYEYSGGRYTSRMNHHPGDRVRVWVDVRPK